MYIHTPDAHNTRAATEMVPVILKLFSPASVLDIGCGTGTWLKVFKQSDATLDLVGVDGPHLDKSKLEVPESLILLHDLSTAFSMNRKFDLVISLEVAEHLPKEAAATFITTLTTHSDTVIFSAAIPGQGGYNHLNEQWPSYWAALFAEHGYQCYNMLREQFWNNPQVDHWYKQNILVFSKNELEANTNFILDLVHPDYWDRQTIKLKTLMHLHDRINKGKAGLYFPFKSLVRSIFRFGKKSWD